MIPTSQIKHTIQYPQFKSFQQCLSWSLSLSTCQQDWDALASAADYNHELDWNNQRNAAQQTAKGMLKLDWQLFLEQVWSYQTTRMHPVTASPKHEILMGHYNSSCDKEYKDETNFQYVLFWCCSTMNSDDDAHLWNILLSNGPSSTCFTQVSLPSWVIRPMRAWLWLTNLQVLHQQHSKMRSTNFGTQS